MLLRGRWRCHKTEMKFVQDRPVHSQKGSIESSQHIGLRTKAGQGLISMPTVELRIGSDTGIAEYGQPLHCPLLRYAET